MVTFLEMLPLPYKPNKDITRNICSIVDQLLTLSEDIKTVNLASRKDQIRSKLEYYEDNLNSFIYQLFSLTDES